MSRTLNAVSSDNAISTAAILSNKPELLTWPNGVNLLPESPLLWLLLFRAS